MREHEQAQMTFMTFIELGCETWKQWRQTLIYIGGALNNKFQILYIIGGAKSNFI